MNNPYFPNAPFPERPNYTALSGYSSYSSSVFQTVMESWRAAALLEVGLSYSHGTADNFERLSAEVYKFRCAEFMAQWRQRFGSRQPVRVLLEEKAARFREYLAGTRKTP